jgi:hypothetical protein
MGLLLGTVEPMPLAERILRVVLVVVPILVLVTLVNEGQEAGNLGQQEG